MAKFFFTAVSNNAQKKVVGSLSGEDEKAARRELNRIGLALLNCSETQPENWENAFEFEAENKNKENIVGEILAKNPENAFDELSTLELKKIIYICRSDASDAEKTAARENSIPRIIEKKKTSAEKAQEAEKRTFTGGLKLILGGGDKKKSNPQEEIWKKYSTDKFEKKLVPKNIEIAEKPTEDEEVKKSPPPEKNGDAEIEIEKEMTAVEPEGKELEATPPAEKPTEEKESAPPPKPVEEKIANEDEEYADEEDDEEAEKKFEKIKVPFAAQLKNAFRNARPKFTRFYFLLTKIVVPPKDKTRGDGWREMHSYFFPPKEEKIVEDKNSLNYQLRTFVETFWVSVEEIIDVLAAVFLAYFLLGVASLFAEIPIISGLAEQTLRGNHLIPFLTAGFIFVRILMFLRDKLTRANPIRTLLLFLVGGATIFVAGVNLL